MKDKLQRLWHLWCKALGDKASPHDHEADKIAIIRTLIFGSYLITNVAICANAVRHWNDVEVPYKIIYVAK